MYSIFCIDGTYLVKFASQLVVYFYGFENFFPSLEKYWGEARLVGERVATITVLDE